MWVFSAEERGMGGPGSHRRRSFYDPHELRIGHASDLDLYPPSEIIETCLYSSQPSKLPGQESTMKPLFQYPEVVEAIAGSLFHNLDQYDERLVEMFFVQRKAEADELASRLLDAEDSGGNVLVVGEPGTGKTMFLSRFLRDFAKGEHPGKVVQHIDLRKGSSGGSQESLLRGLRRRLVQVCTDFFNGCLDHPTADLPALVDDPDYLSSYNYFADRLERKSAQYRGNALCYLFIDDVDYIADDVFCTFLDQLRPFLLSPLFTVIVACRTPAYNTIHSHHDYTISTAFEDVTAIRMRPLPVRSVLEARVELLRRGPDLKTLIKDPFVNMLKGMVKAIRGILQDGPGSEIPAPAYPFTEKQHHLMQMISNGNIRQILKMARRYLTYMATHRDVLQLDRTGFRIGRQAVLELFSEDSKDETIRIVNLNKPKTYEYYTKDELTKQGVVSLIRFGGQVGYVVPSLVSMLSQSQR